MDTVSLIVPVYNAEKYLVSCIESIRQQTYINWELWLVDDGSEDSSSTICAYFCQLDTRVKYIWQRHAGASAARIKGIERSLGEYIIFVDSDDWLDKQALEILMKPILADDSIDLMICSYAMHEKNGIRKLCSRQRDDVQIFSSSKALEMMFSDGEFKWSLWGKVYKKSLFYHDDFINREWPSTYGDDTFVNWHILKYAAKVAYIPLVLYNYRSNSQSIMHQNVTDDKLIYFQIWKDILSDIKDMDSNIAQNVIAVLLRDGYGLLREFLIQGITRTDAWYRCLDIWMSYRHKYKYAIDIASDNRYKILSMSDEEILIQKNQYIRELKEFCAKCTRVYIYGAGRIAKDVYAIMLENKLYIDSFLVSKINGNANRIDGLIVHPIDLINIDKIENVGVVIGLNNRNYIQVVTFLEKMCNVNIFNGGKMSFYYW